MSNQKKRPVEQKAHKINVYLDHETHQRLLKEVAARKGGTISGHVGAIIEEHFALHDEMASTLGTRKAPGEEKQGRIIHTLLAETEDRIGAVIDRQSKRIGGVDRKLAELQAMLDRAVLQILIHLPEVAEEVKEGALASANLRYAKWRKAVEKMLDGGKE